MTRLPPKTSSPGSSSSIFAEAELSRFDLVVSLPRRDGDGVPEELGELLLEHGGAQPADLAELLNEGWVRLRLAADSQFATWLAQKLEAAGGTVEVVDEGAADPVRVAAPAPAAEPNLDDAFGEWQPPVAERAPAAVDPMRAPSGGLALELDFDEPEAAAPPPAAPLRFATPAHVTAPAHVTGPAHVTATRSGGTAMPLDTAVLEPLDEPISFDNSMGAEPIEIAPPPKPAHTGLTGMFPTVSRNPTLHFCPKCSQPLQGVGATCERCNKDPLAYTAERQLVEPEGLREKLAARPTVRFAIGLVLALVLGYSAARPYQNRVEQTLVSLRQQANAYRGRPDPQLAAQALALDAQHDDTARNGAMVAVGVWAGVGGLVLAAWLFATRPRP